MVWHSAIGNEIPSQYSLSQNYPNPFNPVTRIKFHIPRVNGNGSEIVLLKIYNSLGKQVSELVNQDLPPGTYEYEWDASNYSSGVYFYTLTSGFFKETKKMLLIK